jgi:predicted ATPase
MLGNIRVQNFKSIDDLSIDLGRFNVFIGENGCGKSNILESIVFAAAASNNTVENEFLALRGARVAEAKLLRSGFDQANLIKDILIDLNISEDRLSFTFKNDNQPFSKWEYTMSLNDDEEINNIYPQFRQMIEEIPDDLLTRLLSEKHGSILSEDPPDYHSGAQKKSIADLFKAYIDKQDALLNKRNDSVVSLSRTSGLSNYMIFAPENFFLRNFTQEDTFTAPLGHRGEGLLKLIKVIKKEKPDHYKSIVENLSLIDWFSSFDVKEDSSLGETEFSISDKYLEDGLQSFDIRNANEGFLFLLFYITLFTSDYTPSFFSIDNIDTALNPKLCSKLITVLSNLAVKHNKQVIITTHNPSILDGLDLNNENERLFVVARNAAGNTRVKRIQKKSPLEGEQSVKLSEQFLRGYIGGLPKNF